MRDADREILNWLRRQMGITAPAIQFEVSCSHTH